MLGSLLEACHLSVGPLGDSSDDATFTGAERSSGLSNSGSSFDRLLTQAFVDAEFLAAAPLAENSSLDVPVSKGACIQEALTEGA